MIHRQHEIIEKASVLFSQQGIKKTSVDFICQNCGISKKTLYQYFPDKETIVKEIVKNALVRTDTYINELLEISYDAVSELINFFKFIESNLAVFTPAFISDILEFYPSVNEILLEYRTSKFLPFFIKNVERGKAQGVYRESVDSKMTGELYFRQIDFTLEDDSIDISEKNNVLAYINSFFLHGIIKETGSSILFPCSKEIYKSDM